MADKSIMAQIITSSEGETRKFAEKFYQSLKRPTIICISGELGSGKTVFVKGFARALGLKEKQIKSPTYTYVRQYALKKGWLYHFDFYRINELDDLMAHELKELFSRKDSYFLIEWPEKIKDLEIPRNIWLNIKYLGETSRQITW